MYYIFVVYAICVLIVDLIEDLFQSSHCYGRPYHPVDLIIVAYVETKGNIVLHPF